jgi:hypothetical protein
VEDLLETPKQDTQVLLEDPLATVPRKYACTSRMANPVTQDDWIDLMRCDPDGFRAILAAMTAQQPPATAPLVQPAAAAAPRPILFRSNKANTPWQHEYVSSTMIGATIGTEACKAFIPKPWQPPTTNVTVELVNNFLDCVRSK